MKKINQNRPDAVNSAKTHNSEAKSPEPTYHLQDSEIKIAELTNSLQESEAKIAELTNDLQRTRADFENFRKQTELQKTNAKRATELATVAKILPLLDDLDRAFDAYDELKPLAGSMGKTIKDLGLTKITAAAGVEFNPDLHEAIMADGDGDQELISEVLRPGYYYETEVLRPAMVKVHKQ